MEVAERHFNEILDSILASPDSESLRKRQGELEDELREQILLGSTSEVMRIQTELRNYPALILAARSSEIKRDLRNVEESFKDVKRTRQELTELKQKKVRLTEEPILELERLNQEIGAVDLSLGINDADFASLNDQRRSLKAEQQELLSDIRGTKMGEQY
jgi:hypothetical protein